LLTTNLTNIVELGRTVGI